VVLRYEVTYPAPVSSPGATISVINGYRIIQYKTPGSYTLTF
jgi:hypothetical protein